MSDSTTLVNDPSKYLMKAWIDWMKNNNFPKIQLTVRLGECTAPGYSDYPQDGNIVWNIQESSVAYLNFEDTCVNFGTTRQGQHTDISVPYSAIVSLRAVRPETTDLIELPAGAFVQPFIATYSQMEDELKPTPAAESEPKPKSFLRVIK